MAGDDQGPEPTGWELMRSLDRVEKAVTELPNKVVSVDVYNADKQGNTERHQRAEDRLTAIEGQQIEADKLRRANRLTIALAVVSLVLAPAGAYLVAVITK